MATHIPFAGRAKRRQLLPRDPRSPWWRGADLCGEGQGGLAAPVWAVMSSQHPENRPMTATVPSQGKTAPACARSRAPTTTLTKDPVPTASLSPASSLELFPHLGGGSVAEQVSIC